LAASTSRSPVPGHPALGDQAGDVVDVDRAPDARLGAPGVALQKLLSSNPLRMPSIQPQHSTTSIASFGVTDFSPEPTLWILIQASSALSWCPPSHL